MDEGGEGGKGWMQEGAGTSGAAALDCGKRGSWQRLTLSKQCALVKAMFAEVDAGERDALRETGRSGVWWVGVRVWE
jgi:hypothetical protein